MDRKTFTQLLSLKLIPRFVENDRGNYLTEAEEDVIVTNIQCLVNKIYKKCKLEDEDENTNKIEKYNVSNEYAEFCIEDVEFGRDD